MKIAPFFQKFSARFILLGMILSLIPMSQMHGHQHAAPHHHAGEAVQIKPQVVAPETLAALVLQDAQKRGISVLVADQHVLDAHAKAELQLPWLVHSLDRSQTYLGSNGLAQLMNPVNDRAEIERRQHLIKTFLQDDPLYTRISEALQEIAQSEEAVLTYWNPLDPLSASVGHLYFSFGPFKYLNDSKLALEAGTLLDAGMAFKTLVGVLFLQGLINEAFNFMKSGVRPSGKRIIDGFLKLPNSHNPLWTNYMHEYHARMNAAPEVDRDAIHKDMVGKVEIGGTLKDAVLLQDEVWRRQGEVIGSFAKDIKEFFFGKTDQNANNNAAPAPNNANPQNQNAQRPFPWGTLAFYTVGTLYEDYQIYKAVRDSKSFLKHTYQSIELLRMRTIGVADFIKAIQKLEKLVASSPEIKQSLPASVIKNLSLGKSLSAEMKELVALLNTATFKKQAPGKKASIFYSRGKVLYANLLITKIKNQLVPAMQAVAEIDAYCSIARLMKESTNNANKFCFATFTDTPQAYLELENCWIGVLDPKESVANSMMLGQNKPGKVIITGPNGGGKSTWLKAAGHAVVMAQSWGIVPARKARMSIFDAVRTSLEPAEDLEHGLSKFMAQKESMDKVQRFVQHDPTKISLILLDEPYDGTVTDEIARRAGAFCDGIVNSKNCLAVVATHIMPVLADATLYGWYHVDIAEPELGMFKRTFKLKPGLAKRWFEDQAWRGRFIDWLTVEMRNKAIYARTH